jgi:hypothetical protein
MTGYFGVDLSSVTHGPHQEHGARVTAVDNFQGEENKIILLSLVRSNDQERIGYLREANRVCVALSRAKEGLYVFLSTWHVSEGIFFHLVYHTVKSDLTVTCFYVTSLLLVFFKLSPFKVMFLGQPPGYCVLRGLTDNRCLTSTLNIGLRRKLKGV